MSVMDEPDFAPPFSRAGRKKGRRRGYDRMRRVVRSLGKREICDCGLTVAQFQDGCPADLSTLCDGFVTIELTLRPDGSTVEGVASQEQIARCRERMRS